MVNRIFVFAAPSRARRAGWVILALLALLFVYAFAALIQAIDEREDFPAALARYEQSGQAMRQQRRALETLGAVLKRSTDRLQILAKMRPLGRTAAPGEPGPSPWERVVAEQRAGVRNDLALLAKYPTDTFEGLASMVPNLQTLLTDEDDAWRTAGQSLAETPATGASGHGPGEDDSLRRFAAALARISRSVRTYNESLRAAFQTVTERAEEDQRRLAELLAKQERGRRSLVIHLSILIGDLLVLALVLAGMVLSGYRARRA